MPHTPLRPAWHWIIACMLAWCALMFFLYTRSNAQRHAHTQELALTQARTLYEQVIDTRAWNATHGGVYVLESEYGQPNPWIPAEMRTIRTDDGRALVLVNPAYMSRQISDRTNTRGTFFRITSHKPLRPQNKSDTWEMQALIECIAGKPEVFACSSSANQHVFRYLAALRTEHDCLRCHTDDKVGEVRGGVSVTLDAGPFLLASAEHSSSLKLAFGVLGLSGLLTIGGGGLLWRRRNALQEERENLKSAFLANMSHDMRTPLTGILGMSEILQREQEPDVREQALRYVKAASGALLEIVNDITDYAALDNDKTPLERQPFALRATLAECCELFAPQCQTKQLELRVTVEDDLPDRYVGDAFRLRQVLGNLISNAIKFTEKGSVELSVMRDAALAQHMPVTHAEKADAETLPLCFAVTDTGMGIAPEEQERIFVRFERGAAMRQRGLPGTGLGLSIAQELVRRMGGTLALKSSLHAGACFYFSIVLPLAPCDGGAAPVPADGAPTLDSTKTNLLAGPAHTDLSPLPAASVLLVEDNAVTRYYLQHTLRGYGLRVTTALNGQEALDKLEATAADLIIMDIRMPVMDGYAMTQALRHGGGLYARVPIMVLTASLTPEEQAQFAALGVRHYVRKPISAAHLYAHVASCLGVPPRPDGPAAAHSPNVHSTDAPSAPADAPAPTEAAMLPFDTEAALAAMGNDQGLMRHMVSLWLDEAPRCAADLREAMTRNDHTEVRRLAHAWKNSAASLYLNEVRECCARLEAASDEAQRWPALSNALFAAHERSLWALRHYLNPTQGSGV